MNNGAKSSVSHAKKRRPAAKSKKNDIQQKATYLDDEYQQFKKNSEELIAESKKRMDEYKNEIVKNIHEKPLSSVLIAGGIGFILAALLKK
jgi:ElaB/YqjD/DUF883 family membrane-anchored ribosome-binding protein